MKSFSLGQVIVSVGLSILAIFFLMIFITDPMLQFFHLKANVEVVSFIFFAVTLFIFLSIMILFKARKRDLNKNNLKSATSGKISIITLSVIYILFAILPVYVIIKELNKEKSNDDFQRLAELIAKAREENGKIDTSAVKELIKEIELYNIPNWKTISSAEGKFEIDFPDYEISEDKTTQLINSKEYLTHGFSINAQNLKHENLAYRIDYTFLPDINSKQEIETLFNEQRDYILSATNSKLEYELLIDSSLYIGRKLYITVDESNIKCHYRTYFHNNVFYKLMVVTEEGKLFNKSIDRFFNSFVLLED